MIGGFEFAVRPVGRVGFVMEAAVGEWTTEALVKEQEEERDMNAFGREAVGVAAAVALQQSVTFELAQVVAQLVQTVLLGGKLEHSEDGLVNLFGRPAADGTAVVQENFQQPNNPGVVKFDAGITDRAHGDGQGDALQQGKVHMDVEALRLEGSEAIRDREEPLANGVQMVEPFLEAEVAQVIGTEFIAQEAGELLILFQKGVFPVRSENVMTMFDLVEHIGGFSI